MKIAVLGANGRMGRAVVRLAHEAGDTIVYAVGAAEVGRDAGELAGVGVLGVAVTSSLSGLAAAKPDVLVDFSAPAALASACAACATSKIAIVSGTTGLDAPATKALDDAASACAVLWEPNMSVGVHVLAMLVEKAIAALGPSYDAEIVEVHHKAKVDAPSGTAIRLGDVIKSAKSGHYVNGREGRPGPRDPKEIGVHAVRGGDVIGDHTVFFLGDGERIELTHRATNRDLFAHGALRAARALTVRPPGRYRLADLI